MNQSGNLCGCGRNDKKDTGSSCCGGGGKAQNGRGPGMRRGGPGRGSDGGPPVIGCGCIKVDPKASPQKNAPKANK